jgi:hypothetical protein
MWHQRLRALLAEGGLSPRNLPRLREVAREWTAAQPGVVPVLLLGIFLYALDHWTDGPGVPPAHVTAVQAALLPRLEALLDVLDRPDPKALLDALNALAAAVVRTFSPG